MFFEPVAENTERHELLMCPARAVRSPETPHTAGRITRQLSTLPAGLTMHFARRLQFHRGRLVSEPAGRRRVFEGGSPNNLR